MLSRLFHGPVPKGSRPSSGPWVGDFCFNESGSISAWDLLKMPHHHFPHPPKKWLSTRIGRGMNTVKRTFIGMASDHLQPARTQGLNMLPTISASRFLTAITYHSLALQRIINGQTFSFFKQTQGQFSCQKGLPTALQFEFSLNNTQKQYLVFSEKAYRNCMVQVQQWMINTDNVLKKYQLLHLLVIYFS